MYTIPKSSKFTQEELAMELRRLADDPELLYNVPRRAIEDALIEFRNSRISMPMRRNGLVVREPDGSDSSIIRMGPETAVRIALQALADHLEKK